MHHLERLAVVIAIVLLGGTLVLGTARTPEAPTPRPRPVPEPHATQPPIQPPDANAAQPRASQPPSARARGGQPRPEEIERLPLQIHDQVAAQVQPPVVPVSPAELERLPLQIHDQVGQAYSTPNP